MRFSGFQFHSLVQISKRCGFVVYPTNGRTPRTNQVSGFGLWSHGQAAAKKVEAREFFGLWRSCFPPVPSLVRTGRQKEPENSVGIAPSLHGACCHGFVSEQSSNSTARGSEECTLAAGAGICSRAWGFGRGSAGPWPFPASTRIATKRFAFVPFACILHVRCRCSLCFFVYCRCSLCFFV